MELQHHGIKGQKWGVRRFQNKDGSLTSAGQKRYGLDGADKKALRGQVQKSAHAGGYGTANFSNGEKRKFKMDSNFVQGHGTNKKEIKADYAKNREKFADKGVKKWLKDGYRPIDYGLTKSDIDGYIKRHPEDHDKIKEQLGTTGKTGMSTGKKVAIAGAAVAGTALAAYGAKKLHDAVRDKNYKLHMESGRKRVEDMFSGRGFAIDYAYAVRANNIAKVKEMDAFHERSVSKVFDDAARKAATESFGSAFKNVASDMYRNRRRRF